MVTFLCHITGKLQQMTPMKDLVSTLWKCFFYMGMGFNHFCQHLIDFIYIEVEANKKIYLIQSSNISGSAFEEVHSVLSYPGV